MQDLLHDACNCLLIDRRIFMFEKGFSDILNTIKMVFILLRRNFSFSNINRFHNSKLFNLPRSTNTESIDARKRTFFLRISSYSSVYGTEIYDCNTGPCKSSYFVYFVYDRLPLCLYDLSSFSHFWNLI
jgi:hypothetical protein